MQGKDLNRATIGVVSSMDMRGRATADEIKRGLQNEKKRCFWRIASSAIRGCLMAVGLLVALLAPLPASADEGGIPAEIAALKAQLAALQRAVETLQTSNSALQNQVNSLQSSNATLQAQLAAVQSNHALLLGPFVSVDPKPEIGVIGPNIIFSGANIHIVSGSGRTDDNGNATGLGNLIIGYDEDPINYPAGGPGGGFLPLSPGDRSGSHNLVIGGGNRFTQAAFGGLVAGELNAINSFASSITGGYGNHTGGNFASISGGTFNTASGSEGSSVSGGFANIANGPLSSVSGGQFNIASGDSSSVSGGAFNGASANFTSVSGGQDNQARGDGSSVSGGAFNTAFGEFGSVTGGFQNTAGGGSSVVLGGQNNTDNKDNSIAPQPPFP